MPSSHRKRELVRRYDFPSSLLSEISLKPPLVVQSVLDRAEQQVV
jgi:hypothetical protein